MKRFMAIATLILGSLVGQTTRGDIIFTGGAADLTFYYESAADRWDVVFQSKSNTVATGLNSPYSGFTGIVGQSPSNFNFNTALSTNFSTDRFVTVGSTTYAVARASGSPFNVPSNLAIEVSPDLGIRTRLRENQVALGTGANTAANQFDSFNLTLNLAASTFFGVSMATAGSPSVSLLNWSGTNPLPMIDSANGQLTANFSNFAHVHRNWGFSQSGEYNLAFDIQGVGGTYGANAGTGRFVMGFNVTAVPEPSSICLIGAAGLGIVSLRMRRRD